MENTGGSFLSLISTDFFSWVFFFASTGGTWIRPSHSYELFYENKTFYVFEVMNMHDEIFLISKSKCLRNFDLVTREKKF